MSGPYINQEGHEVPDKTILVIPFDSNGDGFYKEVIESMAGNVKRDWFDSHYYYCLPLNIGNQQGFIIKSLRDFDVEWDGTGNDAIVTFLNEDNSFSQTIKTGFRNGVITIQNNFSLKTPLGVNIMTIQPPNMFIPGCAAMTGIIETDQIRRDFTFNLKVTVPGIKISIKKGDPLGAFIVLPRYFGDEYQIKLASEFFNDQIILNELNDQNEFSRQRNQEDKQKAHECGRKYFNGIHAFGDAYQDHQKKII